MATTRKWQEIEPSRVRVVEICEFYSPGDETKPSIEPGALITEVRPASWLKDSIYYHFRWLEGTLEGRVGLVPEFCVEYVP